LHWIVDKLEAALDGRCGTPSARPACEGFGVKIGLLLPRDGPAGLWSPSTEASALLAVAEINARGGIRGHPVDLVLGDAGGTVAEAAEAADDLIVLDEVDLLVGMHPSDMREAVTAAVRGRRPYLYTPQYEGGRIEAGVTATGVTAAELLRPGLHWLSEERGARRFFIVGNDYVWPQVSSAVARALIRDGGGTLVGQSFLPYGARDYDPVFAAIRRTRADVVILLLLGQEAITFSRAFAEKGLDRRHLRFALATDETVLYGIGAEASAGLYITATYLATLRSAGNDGFLERYHASFGAQAPTPNSFCQSCYDALHALAGRPRPAPRRAVHLAEADGLDFRVIASF